MHTYQHLTLWQKCAMAEAAMVHGIASAMPSVANYAIALRAAQRTVSLLQGREFDTRPFVGAARSDFGGWWDGAHQLVCTLCKDADFEGIAYGNKDSTDARAAVLRAAQDIDYNLTDFLCVSDQNVLNCVADYASDEEALIRLKTYVRQTCLLFDSTHFEHVNAIMRAYNLESYIQSSHDISLSWEEGQRQVIATGKITVRIREDGEITYDEHNDTLTEQ